MSTQAPERPVGVDLQDASDDARSVVQAIEQDIARMPFADQRTVRQVGETGVVQQREQQRRHQRHAYRTAE